VFRRERRPRELRADQPTGRRDQNGDIYTQVVLQLGDLRARREGETDQRECETENPNEWRVPVRKDDPQALTHWGPIYHSFPNENQTCRMGLEKQYTRDMRLLVVDDDVELRDLLVRALERDRHQVTAVPNVELARQTLDKGATDLVVLDLALPDGTGVELCREMRQSGSDVPVLMLTAHSEVGRRVRALDAGADDFLAKPFAVAELRARVRALGRRSGVADGAIKLPRLVHADTIIDCAARRATRGKKFVTLTAREWTILEALANQPRRVVTRVTLLSEGWGDGASSAAASLEVLIGRIRRKLGDEVIRTVRGEGYVLEAS
jgi:two-component system OmpR family response regulator